MKNMQDYHRYDEPKGAAIKGNNIMVKIMTQVGLIGYFVLFKWGVMDKWKII